MFWDVNSDGFKQMMPDSMIVKILSKIQCEIIDSGRTIKIPGEEMHNLYLIKQGEVVCFDA